MKKIIYSIGAFIVFLISAVVHEGTILEFSIIVGCSWLGLTLLLIGKKKEKLKEQRIILDEKLCKKLGLTEEKKTDNFSTWGIAWQNSGWHELEVQFTEKGYWIVLISGQMDRKRMNIGHFKYASSLQNIYKELAGKELIKT